MIAAYIRISSDEQKNGYGLDIQRDKIEKYCNLYDLGQPEFFVDDGETGSNMDRPALKRLLDRIEDFEQVVVYKSGRLSRSLKNLMILLEDKFEPNDVAFTSVTEPFDTSTANGKMFLQMLGSFSEFERNTITERTMSGKQSKAKEGGFCGGQVPYGYDNQDGDLLINSQEAAVVKRIFMYRNDFSFTLREIANTLNKQGAPTRRGGKWYPQTISYILKNPIYQGNMTFNADKQTVSAQRKDLAIA